MISGCASLLACLLTCLLASQVLCEGEPRAVWTGKPGQLDARRNALQFGGINSDDFPSLASAKSEPLSKATQTNVWAQRPKIEADKPALVVSSSAPSSPSFSQMATAAAAKPQRANSWPMSGPSSLNQQQCGMKPKVDMLTLSLSWFPGLCAAGEKTCYLSSRPAFIIHGLWPKSSSGKPLLDCDCQERSTHLNMRALAPLIPRLEQVWISPYDPRGPKGQWHHEWKKHGTCGQHLPKLRDQLSYFKMTLDLNSRVNILASLKKANFVPSNKQPYLGTQLIQAMKAVTNGHSVRLTCLSKSGLQHPVLTEVQVCFDPQTFQPMDCPSSPRACGGQIYLLNNP